MATDDAETAKAAHPGGDGGLLVADDQLAEQIGSASNLDYIDSLAEEEPIPRWNLSDIIIGDRHRKDLGDVAELARSILEVGLLHPPVINDQGFLIAGRRRLAAWELLFKHQRKIPVRVVPLTDIARGEAAENFARKDFTLSEAVAIKQAIEPAIKAAATDRMKAGKPLSKLDKGRAADKVSTFTGVKRTTLAKAEAVVKAAAAEPERFSKLVEAMDRTGRVDGPFQRLQVIRQSDLLRLLPPPLPMRGPYRVAVIDFPWPNEPDATQEQIDARGRSLRPYPAMSIDAGCAFMRDKVAGILAPDCVVGFLTTNFHMPHAFTLLAALGFEQHSTILTWEKDRMGRGQVLRDKTEHCIFALRGTRCVTLTNESTWLPARRRENSRKPDELYDLIERVFPAPRYAEIFSRGGRGPLWDCHGDQIGKFSTEAA
jgi:N6-adenosine-specific RNA methylase IME4